MDKRSVFVLPSLALVGPGRALDDRGRFPLLGVTTPDVARLELRYADDSHPVLAKNGDGGFVVMADAWRPLRELIAYDAAGHVRDRNDLSSVDMSYRCEREPVCPNEPGNPPRAR